MSHYIKKCGSCGRIIEQCRCASCDKEVYLGTCVSCAKIEGLDCDSAKPSQAKIEDKRLDCDSVDTKFMNNPSRLTDSERKVLDMSAQLWNAICELPKVHPMQNQEICTAIHDIQMRILARSVTPSPAYRRAA